MRDSLASKIEKGFEDFNSSISSIQKDYNKICRQIGQFQIEDHVPRDYLTEMAGNLAHEIRNPLGGIATFVELLADETNHKRENSIKGILHGVDRIDKIVENLIIFSRRITVQLVSCNFTDIILRAVETAKRQLGQETERYTFSLNIDAKLVFVNIDPVLILQAIQNVLQNAVENMTVGGDVLIRLTEPDEEATVELTIQDDGGGLAEPDAEKPFYPFYTTKTNGMGLGLPTSRLIIKKHDGDIWLRNNTGKGVVVGIRLPAHRNG